MFEVTTGSHEDRIVVGYATGEEAAYALLGREIVEASRERGGGSMMVSEPTVRELSGDEVDRMRELFAPLFATHDLI
jgi:hypothetical protein